MQTQSAKDAKYNFGRLIDTAWAEPVVIEKHGLPVVVVLSIEEYRRLVAIEAVMPRLALPLQTHLEKSMTELSFKGKEFVYNHHLAVPFRPLVPHPKKGIGPVALDGNLIIHGDNLHALKALLPTTPTRSTAFSSTRRITPGMKAGVTTTM